jgi:uncharacterized membrane protein
MEYVRENGDYNEEGLRQMLRKVRIILTASTNKDRYWCVSSEQRHAAIAAYPSPVLDLNTLQTEQ